MLKEAVIEHGAPTLAGLKTGNLFSVKMQKAELLSEIRALNAVLTKKGLRLVPVRKTDRNTLVYLYRPGMLRTDLGRREAAAILKRKGYNCSNPSCCIVQLAEHLAHDSEFPHEIGLFLGYPPHDVKCFMKDPTKGVQCSGCWKAYHNSKRAAETFERFLKCTEEYKRRAENGGSLEELIVTDAFKK